MFSVVPSGGKCHARDTVRGELVPVPTAELKSQFSEAEELEPADQDLIIS